MGMEDEPIIIPDDAENTFVPVVVARSDEEAEVYCELLSDHEIPAVIADEDALDGNGHHVRHGMTHGVPILVPEPLLDEAGEIIAAREKAEDLLASDDDEDAAEDLDDEDDHFGLTEVDDDDDDDLGVDPVDLFGDDDDDDDEF